MSEKTIWAALRSGGLSEAGAAGMMGNMYCESLLRSNNVEDRCSLSDDDYTNNVDRGFYPESKFVHDAYGYGLCQWTYYTRKQELYNLAKSKGCSINDETMQVELCLKELKRDNSSLYTYLCSTTDIYTAASRICIEYERPAVNNVQPRYNKAQEYYNRNTGTEVTSTPTSATTTANFSVSGTGSSWIPSVNQSTDICSIEVRCVRAGDSGDDVYALQCMLNRKGPVKCGNADGMYGGNTLAAVNALKAQLGMTQDAQGIATQDVLQFLYS